MSDPTPAPAEQNTDPAPSGEAQSGPARETDNSTQAELRILRKQLKEREQKLASFEQAAAEKARAEMTEVERYKSEAEQARLELEKTRSEVTNERKANAFRLAAIQAGVSKPDVLLRLADLSGLEIENGQVVGVDTLIRGLRKEVPEMFVAQTTAAASGGNPRDGVPKDMTVEMLRTASRDQFADIARARGDKHFPR